jgi:transcriptional regulator of heat shock response
MEQHVKMSLDEWKAEIEEVLKEIDAEYEEVKNELKVYTYKFNITKQVVQSTVNPDLNRKIRELYQQPFEEKFNDLKEYIKELEEKKRVFQMFTDKIEKVTEKEDAPHFAVAQSE